MRVRPYGSRRWAVSKSSLIIFLITVIYATFVYVRLYAAQLPFSFDYGVYLTIIDSLKELTFQEMMTEAFSFPYVVKDGIVPIEFGFSILLKYLTSLGLDAEIVFALIAAGSVALRVYTMEALGVPRPWILVLNIFAVTLLESNALRLGVASSVLLYGLYRLYISKKVSGGVALAVSTTFHMQVVIFILPFILFYVFLDWISRSRLRIFFTLAVSSIGVLLSLQFIPLIQNEKIAEYVSRGASGSAGISVVSMLSALFLFSAAMTIRREALKERNSKFWVSILSASLPALILLLFLTNIAVVGDRAWQLAYLIVATFFLSKFRSRDRTQFSYYVLIGLTFVMLTNVLVRYPLSDFFAPPFPSIESII